MAFNGKPYKIYVNDQGKEIETFDGFSWFAFLLTPIWAFLNNLVMHAILSIVCAFTGIGLIYWIVAGLKGNEWHRDYLEEKGFYPKGEKSIKKNSSNSNNLDKLKQLSELKEKGAITEAEYNEKKAELLKNI